MKVQKKSSEVCIKIKLSVADWQQFQSDLYDLYELGKEADYDIPQFNDFYMQVAAS